MGAEACGGAGWERDCRGFGVGADEKVRKREFLFCAAFAIGRECFGGEE